MKAANDVEEEDSRAFLDRLEGLMSKVCVSIQLSLIKNLIFTVQLKITDGH